MSTKSQPFYYVDKCIGMSDDTYKVITELFDELDSGRVYGHDSDENKSLEVRYFSTIAMEKLMDAYFWIKKAKEVSN